VLLVSRFFMAAYLTLIVLLSLYGIHRYWILYLYYRYYKWAKPAPVPPLPDQLPIVTVQLPVYNERYVVERLVDAVCRMDYPKERLEVQVLDDSTDDTEKIVRAHVSRLGEQGFLIEHIRRNDRTGFKAGALAAGLAACRGEFIAIFDADFVPPADFLKKTLPYFGSPRIGMVQTRWGHLNENYSLLTWIQSIFLDGHFLIEHTARNRSGAFFNFNGTAGIWRKDAIVSSGGWQHDTLTEDLDLSYRAQMKGWQFVYLPDVVCPAELPVDINAFKTQQNRWTMGAIQTAKKNASDHLAQSPATQSESGGHLPSDGLHGLSSGRGSFGYSPLESIFSGVQPLAPNGTCGRGGSGGHHRIAFYFLHHLSERPASGLEIPAAQSSAHDVGGRRHLSFQCQGRAAGTLAASV